jgi:hypothetical protein
MIAYQAQVCRCACCHGFATREIVDEFGEQLPLCNRCPSPDEIRRHTADFRATWDEVQYCSRRYGLTREMALDVHSVRVDEVAVVNHKLPVRRGKSLMAVEP